MRRWTLSFLKISLNFVGPLKFLSNPRLSLNNPLFLFKMASLSSHSTCQFPMATGGALSKCNKKMASELCHHTSTGGFSLLIPAAILLHLKLLQSPWETFNQKETRER
jgi:hypothetical protein